MARHGARPQQDAHLHQRGARLQLRGHRPDPWAELILAQQRDSIAAATRANVTIYPIDPRGLGQDDTILIGDNVDAATLAALETLRLRTRRGADTAPADRPSRAIGGVALLRRMRAEVERAQMALRLIADDTGGFALNTNDLGKWLKKIVTQSSSYYLLGYAPTNNRREGKFRRIRVRVKRPGLRVIARRGYIEAFDTKRTAPLPALTNSSPEVREILNGAWPVGDLPLTATAVAFRGQIEFVGRGHPRIALRQPLAHKCDGKLTGTVEVSTVAVDQGNRSPRANPQDHLRTDAGDPRALQAEGVPHDGPAGRSEAGPLSDPHRRGARASSLRGSLWYDVEVPDFVEGRSSAERRADVVGGRRSDADRQSGQAVRGRAHAAAHDGS